MIKLGIIGTGGMANTHALFFKKIKGVELTACCDVDLKKAGEYAKKHCINNFYSDAEEMLKKRKVGRRYGCDFR